MNRGEDGAFVIAWAQVGVEFDPGDGSEISEGMALRWRGRAQRMDRPGSRLHRVQGPAPGVRRGLRRVAPPPGSGVEPEVSLPANGFLLSDGQRRYTVMLVETEGQEGPLLLCEEGLPPPETLLRVVQTNGRRGRSHRSLEPEGAALPAGIAADTPVETDTGPRAAGDLLPGERLRTADGGWAELAGLERCHMTGARLVVLPELRPIRIRAGALGGGLPHADLLLGPAQLLRIGGAATLALFGLAEVQAAAGDLDDGGAIRPASGLRTLDLVQPVLAEPAAIVAAGVPVEAVDHAGAFSDLRRLAPWEVQLLHHAPPPGIDSRAAARISAAVGA